MSFQQVIIIGRLGRDPELKYMPDGTGVCNMSVATDRKWKDKAGQLQEATTWFRVEVWGKQGENAHQYLKKGRLVQVVGELRGDDKGNPRIWTTKDGEARASFELRANTVTFLGGKNDSNDDDDDDGAPF